MFPGVRGPDSAGAFRVRNSMVLPNFKLNSAVPAEEVVFFKLVRRNRVGFWCRVGLVVVGCGGAVVDSDFLDLLGDVGDGVF